MPKNKSSLLFPPEMREMIDAAMEKAVAPMRSEIDTLRNENKELRDRQTSTRYIERIVDQEALGGEAGRQQMTVRGTQMGLTAAGIIRAFAAGKGDLGRARAWSTKMHGKDHAVTKALAASDFDSGGSLVHPAFAAEVIELLRPRSVVRSLNPRVLPLVNGTMSWGKQTGAIQAFYTGENQNIQSTEPTTGDMTLTGKKLAAIVPVSSDLIRVASVRADEWVRDELVTTCNLRSDLAFIRGDGFSETPRGMRYWAAVQNIISGNTASQATSPTLTQITQVLGDLWQRLADADVRFLQPGFLMAPRTARVLMDAKTADGLYVFRQEMLERGTLNGAPYRITTQIPINLPNASTELYYADFADLIIGEEETMEISISNEASYIDAQGVMQSSFSRDQTLVKVVMIHDFGARHDVSIAVQTDLRWAVGP